MRRVGFTGNILLRMLLTVPLRFKGLILIPILTSLFPSDLYGVWVQIIILRDLLTGVTTARLDMALVRYLEGERDALRTTKAIFTVTLVSGLMLVGLLALCAKPLARLVFDDARFSRLLLPAGAWVVVSALLQITLAVFRARMKIGTLSFREFLSALWLILSATIAWHFRLRIEHLLFLCAVGDGLILVWVLCQLRLFVPISFSAVSYGLLRKYLRYSAPLVVSFFLLWCANFVDRFCVVKLLGLETVGIYVVTYQISNVVVCLVNPVNYVLLPQITGEWERGRRTEAIAYISKAYGLAALLGIPAIVGICLLYARVVTLLAGPQYVASWSLALFLSLSVVLDRLCVASTYVYHLHDKTYLLPFVRGATSLCNLALCWLLTTRLGLLGAGLGRLITFFCVLLFLVVRLRRTVPLHVPFGTILKATVASLIMGLVVAACPKQTLTGIVMAVIAGSLLYGLLLMFLGVLAPSTVAYYLWSAVRRVLPRAGGAGSNSTGTESADSLSPKEYALRE